MKTTCVPQPQVFQISHWKAKGNLYILLMILEDSICLFICGVGGAAKILLLTGQSSIDYHIEDISSSSEV